MIGSLLAGGPVTDRLNAAVLVRCYGLYVSIRSESSGVLDRGIPTSDKSLRKGSVLE